MDDEVMEQALRWHAASERGDCDWQRFTAWLEASPRHRQAYDDVALLEDQIVRHRDGLARSKPRRNGAGARHTWRGAALAAGLALCALFLFRPSPTPVERLFTAQSGAMRQVTLAGGVQVVLAPGSSLAVAGRHEERLRLDGSAWFDVPHDPARQLVIEAGPYRLRDIGTRFEAMSEGGLLKVAVVEGEVGVVLPGHAAPLVLAGGKRLLVAGDPPIAEYGDAVADEVAAWRTGRLAFRNEPLSMVASQLGRLAGLTVTVDASVAQRRFSGVLAPGDGMQPVEQLGRIMGLHPQWREGGAVHLAAAGGEPAGR